MGEEAENQVKRIAQLVMNKVFKIRERKAEAAQPVAEPVEKQEPVAKEPEEALAPEVVETKVEEQPKEDVAAEAKEDAAPQVQAGVKVESTATTEANPPAEQPKEQEDAKKDGDDANEEDQ